MAYTFQVSSESDSRHLPAVSSSQTFVDQFLCQKVTDYNFLSTMKFKHQHMFQNVDTESVPKEDLLQFIFYKDI